MDHIGHEFGSNVAHRMLHIASENAVHICRPSLNPIVPDCAAAQACAPGDWRELMLQQGQFAPWAAKVMWEADPIKDASSAICHLFSTHAAAIVMHGEGAAAVGDLCSLMGGRKVPQMAAALLCQVLAAVLTSAAEVPWDTFLAAAAHAGTAVSAAHARHGMEGAGMAAVIIEAACSAGLRRGGVVGVLRTLLPHLPPGSLAPEAQGVLRAVLVQAVTAAPETAAEIVEGALPAPVHGCAFTLLLRAYVVAAELQPMVYECAG